MKDALLTPCVSEKVPLQNKAGPRYSTNVKEEEIEIL